MRKRTLCPILAALVAATVVGGVATPAEAAGLEDANSDEFDEATPHPVISTMPDQQDVVAGERAMADALRCLKTSSSKVTSS